jgi:hypothetical protein
MNIKVPHGSILCDPITVEGYKFFYINGQIQCATCLRILWQGRDPEIPMEKGKVAELVINKDCDCPKQR